MIGNSITVMIVPTVFGHVFGHLVYIFCFFNWSKKTKAEGRTMNPINWMCAFVSKTGESGTTKIMRTRLNKHAGIGLLSSKIYPMDCVCTARIS